MLMTIKSVSLPQHTMLWNTLNQINDPMVHKAMLIAICNNFIEFHNDVAEKIAEKGDLQRAAAWMRDAGKFQSIVNIAATVCGGMIFSLMMFDKKAG